MRYKIRLNDHKLSIQSIAMQTGRNIRFVRLTRYEEEGVISTLLNCRLLAALLVFISCALFINFSLTAYILIGPFSCCYPSPGPEDTGHLLLTFLANVPLLVLPLYLLILVIQRFRRLKHSRKIRLWLPYRFHLSTLCIAHLTSGALALWVLKAFQRNLREGGGALLLGLAFTLLISGFFEFVLFPPALAQIPHPRKPGGSIQI